MDYSWNTGCYLQEKTEGKPASQNPEQFLTEYRMHINLLTKVTTSAREQNYHNLLESSFWTQKESVFEKKNIKKTPF